jgi:hypothetical protein
MRSPAAGLLEAAPVGCSRLESRTEAMTKKRLEEAKGSESVDDSIASCPTEV